MKNYAMLVDNRVIDILINLDTAPKWPPTPEGIPVVSIECNETVKIGMVYDFETNTFSEYIPESIPEPEYTLTQLDRIESMISKSQEQIAQEARDAYTLELINSGII